MESVRYLIKMRDDNKARREAREKEEREKMGLPAIEDKVLNIFLLVRLDNFRFPDSPIEGSYINFCTRVVCRSTRRTTIKTALYF